MEIAIDVLSIPADDLLAVLNCGPLPLLDRFKSAGGRRLFWQPESTRKRLSDREPLRKQLLLFTNTHGCYREGTLLSKRSRKKSSPISSDLSISMWGWIILNTPEKLRTSRCLLRATYRELHFPLQNVPHMLNGIGQLLQWLLTARNGGAGTLESSSCRMKVISMYSV